MHYIIIKKGIYHIVDRLTFPCTNLWTPHANTFGSDIHTVMIAIEGIHSYHIFWNFLLRFVPQQMLCKRRKS